jgi:hypothetical protein
MLVNFVDIWYILWKFGICLPELVYCTKKNLATLEQMEIMKYHAEINAVENFIQDFSKK